MERGSPSYQALFPTQEECAQLAGMPVELTFCTMEKFLNMNTAGLPVDLVTCCYTDSSFKRLETGGGSSGLCRTCWISRCRASPCQKIFVLVVRQFAGESLCVSPYGHRPLPEEPEQADAVLIARRDLLEKIPLGTHGL